MTFSKEQYDRLDAATLELIRVRNEFRRKRTSMGTDYSLWALQQAIELINLVTGGFERPYGLAEMVEFCEEHSDDDGNLVSYRRTSMQGQNIEAQGERNREP